MTSSTLPIALAACWTIALGLAGAKVTDIGPWYRALRKPSWQPPDWLFAPVWTTIFVCAAIAFVQGWQAPDAGPATHRALIVAWLLNAVANVAWSYLFFRSKRPDWAMAELAVLVPSILAMMAVVGGVRPVLIWWLVPYLVWVSFATVLNRAIIARNAPFDR
jgi:tryptophan-rich sensory protein